MTDTGAVAAVPGTAAAPRHQACLFIGGAWVEPRAGDRIQVLSASTEEVIGSVPEGSAEDVDAAVAAARAAWEPWASAPVARRAELLRALQAALAARNEEIGNLVAGEVGMPLRLAVPIQAGLPTYVAGLYAQIAEEFAYEETIGNSLVIREPVGVVGAITPWNYPLHQTVAKVAPALAAGCTVVHKPSELAPLTAFVLAEAIADARFPPGVFNLVTGVGSVAGEAIAAHPDVDMVSFTGSTRAGRRVGELAARTVKRVALELGGKSANLILDDADLPRAVANGVNNAFLNSGQTCTAWTRMLVPRQAQEEVVELAVAAAAKLGLGDPFDESTRLGPLISEAQRDRVRAYIASGIAEGARLATGGAEPPDDLDRGYYVRPTVLADVTPEMTVAREEIFGPVLSIMPYDDEDHAVRIANATIYGLSGAVWSGDPQRAERVARRLRTGQVDLNGASFNPLAPFGGYRQSGVGRELGRLGFEEFLETKSLQRQ